MELDWGKYTEVADRFQHKARAQDREDLWPKLTEARSETAMASVASIMHEWQRAPQRLRFGVVVETMASVKEMYILMVGICDIM